MTEHRHQYAVKQLAEATNLEFVELIRQHPTKAHESKRVKLVEYKSNSEVGQQDLVSLAARLK